MLDEVSWTIGKETVDEAGLVKCCVVKPEVICLVIDG